MIIGNGQLAQAFQNMILNDVCIFASGVSNSNCTKDDEFEREKRLLLRNLVDCKDKKFVYFSSCALSAIDYPKNPYYRHKKNMEELIMEKSKNYYIFRIPQLFGELKHHNTLINFLHESISLQKNFTVYSEAYRYVIEINDVRRIVSAYLRLASSCKVINIANTYRYKVLDIVNIFEELLGMEGIYEIINKHDGYKLDLSDLECFLIENKIDTSFSEHYLRDKLKEKIK